MYLKNGKNKITSYYSFKTLHDLINADEKNENLGERFFKAVVVDILVENLESREDLKYKMSEEDIEKIADEMINNEVIWEVIEEHINNSLLDYKIEEV